MPAALVAAMGDEGDRVAPRFDRGCRAFVVLEREAVVAYGWLSKGPEWVGELSVEIRPAPNEAYVWNCCTLAEHRRHGHYRSLLDGIVAASRRDGIARLWIGSVEHPAEKADADAGFTAVAECHVTTVLGLRWLRVRAAAGAAPELMEAARARMAPAHALDFARKRIH